ncbi:SH3 domain-containing protein [Agathobacter sp.]|jgi:uncharacterized protein YgiM (DUF1202 family)|uniref:SH3 domain-containing protein n=1 Tax=Agathobacter sp. TaxID=2021311 RepID=UPI003AB88A48
MKPSHRKDVIIARIIFLAICIALISVIAAVIFVIVSKHSGGPDEQEPAAIVSESETATDDNTYVVGGQNTENIVQDVHVITTGSVNLREQGNKDAKILAILKEGTQLKLLSEDNGWTQVDYNGQTGYVSSEYVKHADQIDSEEGQAEEDQTSQTQQTTDQNQTDQNTTDKSTADGSASNTTN